MNLEAIYGKLPVFFQKIAVNLIGLIIHKGRFNRLFYKQLRISEDRHKVPAAEIKRLQRDRLRDHLIAARGSQYWRKIFQKYDVDPYSNNPFDEILKLPVLTKNEVQDNAADIINQDFDKKTLLKKHTSGTTGAGLIFWETKKANAERWAIWWRYRKAHGIDLDKYCGYLGGRSVVPMEQTKPPYWRNNHFGKQVLFSGYHLSQETLDDYIFALKKFNIKWLHGYPSTLTMFAQLVDQSPQKYNLYMDVISIGGESLLDHQKQIIEDIFNCRVIQHYGLQESAANISECPQGHLHVDEDLSYVEFLPTEIEDTKVVVGTNWSNPAFPLFRYDTNDRIRISDNPPECDWTGRQVISIDGRKEDYVQLPNGTKVGRLDHIFKDMVDVREAQIKQLTNGDLVIYIVPSSNFDDKTKDELMFEAKKRLGNEIKIAVEIVDKIPRTRAGKLRFVVSEIKENKIK